MLSLSSSNAARWVAIHPPRILKLLQYCDGARHIVRYYILQLPNHRHLVGTPKRLGRAHERLLSEAESASPTRPERSPAQAELVGAIQHTRRCGSTAHIPQ